jgi:hypothetical protein
MDVIHNERQSDKVVMPNGTKDALKAAPNVEYTG